MSLHFFIELEKSSNMINRKYNDNKPNNFKEIREMMQNRKSMKGNLSVANPDTDKVQKFESDVTILLDQNDDSFPNLPER